MNTTSARQADASTNAPAVAGSSRPRSSLAAILTISLAILVGVLIARFHARPASEASDNLGGSFDFASAFAGGVVAQTGGLTVLTSEAGNEDLLVVLDARNEELFIYRSDLKVGMQLLQRYPVAQLFTDARARTIGGP
jgi:hypothetical protein